MSSLASDSNGATSVLSGRRILVVDDHDDSRALLKVVFRRVGALVIDVGSAAEALDVLQSEHVDLVISDYNMPGFDGLWLIDQLRALEPGQGRDTPALLVTAFGCPELTKKACDSGYHGCLDKPLQTSALLADAERLVAANPLGDVEGGGRVLAWPGPVPAPFTAGV